jgi:hypothetical protein
MKYKSVTPADHTSTLQPWWKDLKSTYRKYYISQYMDLQRWNVLEIITESNLWSSEPFSSNTWTFPLMFSMSMSCN